MTIAFMTFVAPDWSLEQHLTAAIRYGYDGIEPRCAVGHQHGIELTATKPQRKALRAQCADCGVALPALATWMRYNFPDPAQVAEMVEETKKYLQLAADLGAPNLRVFGGPPPDEGVSHEEGARRVAEGLAQCVETAAACGVNLCLETHDFFCRAEHAALVVNAVNHPRLGFNWDLVHTARMGETPEESWAHLAGRVYHCHVHDYTWTPDQPDELQPALMGQGLVPHAEDIRLLKAAGYEGALSGEWIGDFPAEEILPQAAGELRRWMGEG
jgi:sugar phosphate isomerase/epimerase